MKFLNADSPIDKRFCSIEPMTLMGLSAGAGAAGNIFSSIFGSSAAKQQAAAIRYAADQAKETALTMNQRAREDVQPFRDMGVKAGNSLTDLLFGGGDMKSFLKSSDLFNFQSDIGTRNINRDLKAKGLYGSGAGLAQLAQFNDQLVGEEGQRTYDRLFGLTQLGSNAAAQQASNTTQTGNTVANLQTQAGIQYGQAIGDSGRSLASLGQGIAQPIQSGIANYTNYSLYSPLMQAYANRMTTGNGLSDSQIGSLSLYAGNGGYGAPWLTPR